ncbi:3-demethylubiquinone-9 3-O-methyltransferase [Pneumocystis carinii B80]|uniref:Ubiquinone biosynthesis O-methyltransferase, mitochondrial n=1 Tax=Pneumocystis carinii (strain B80) TaxID=1408658 RepID=A0A0W4ZC47_PNEC8|nr:3-demethylubiquinone-9 3-O-methyltransferase [Pneumocystis carinii B80]KTW25983.1 3-demethylubiquinone-9 3-O-methyltransferase [Pneumocystis carinii B80]
MRQIKKEFQNPYKYLIKRYSSSSLMEIQHFDNLSEDWWNLQGRLKLLHKMNSVRIEYIKQCLILGEQKNSYNDKITNDVFKRKFLTGKWLLNKCVLDVGCGGGILSESLSRLGALSVLGIDISSKAIEAAQMHQKKDPCLTNLIYRKTTAETLLNEKKQYDLITAMEIIEHVNHPKAFITTLFDLLKPGGLLILSTIEKTLLSFFITIIVAERLLQLVPNSTHTWSKFIKRSEIKTWVSQYPGVSIIDCRGVIFLPWKNQWKIMDRNAIWAQQCNYFIAIQKEKNQEITDKKEISQVEGKSIVKENIKKIKELEGDSINEDRKKRTNT